MSEYTTVARLGLMIAVSVVATSCGGSPPLSKSSDSAIRSPRKSQDIQRVDVLPVPEPIVLFMHSDDLFEPVLCCEDGRCRTEDCARLVPEGDVARDQVGVDRKLVLHDTIDCPGIGTTQARSVLRTDTPSRWMKPALWPATAAHLIWWRGQVRYQDPPLLTAAERAELSRAGLEVDSAHIDVAAVDLDGDERAEGVVTVDGREGGVFMRRRGDTGPLLVRLLATDSPLLIGAIDLDGDQMREILALDTSVAPFDFVVLDVLAHGERFRTKWYCKGETRSPDPIPDDEV